MSRLIAFAALLVAAPLAAQSPLVGTWQVTYQSGLRNENGEVTPVMGKATLVLAQRGDSLVGTFTPAPNDEGRARPPIAFAAKADGASVTFLSSSKARMNVNGDEQSIDVKMTWSLRADGDALSGTLTRVMDGMDMGSTPSQITGTRAH